MATRAGDRSQLSRLEGRGSRTVTVDQAPTSSGGQSDGTADPSRQSVVGRLVLRGAPSERDARPRQHHGRRVAWSEGTVDNEGLGKRKSKKCCIYHKPRKFDESSSSESSTDSESSSSGTDSDDDTSDDSSASGPRPSASTRARRDLRGMRVASNDAHDHEDCAHGHSHRSRHHRAGGAHTSRTSRHGPSRGSRTQTITEAEEADEDHPEAKEEHYKPNRYERGPA